MAKDNSRAQDVALLQKHVDALGEHFDSVQIFCTRHDPARADGTVAVQLGVGNWYARYGHITDWIARQDWERREPGSDDQAETF